jgi:hypothetical protein
MFSLFAALKRVTPLAAFSLLLAAAGCNQDAIFDYISGETAPTKALIQGAPSKIVEAAGKLYIANGRIWEYELSGTTERWSRSSGPEGYVADVAATTDGRLYALTIDNTATQVWRKNDSGWTPVDRPDPYVFIHTIFGAGDVLFATGAKGAGDNDYAILYCGQSDSALIDSQAAGDVLLTGAGKVGSDYYLAAQGQGIYKASGAGSLPTLESADPPIPRDIVGLFQAEKDAVIIGISKGGVLVRIDSSGIKVDAASLGGTYTGALALMDSPDSQGSLLLLGYKDANSLYKHGYKELQFNSSDGTHDGTPRIPGENQPSSVSDYRQYDSSLRRYPVEAFWVLPKRGESPQVIFAVTSNQGLYSYRDRSDGGWQWNHEE